MRNGTAVVTAAVLLAAVGCGGSSSGPSTGPAVATGAVISQSEALASQVRSAAISYGAEGGPGMTLAGCAAAHDAYDALVRPWLSQLVQASGSLDAFMGAHGGSAYEDTACVASAMLQELDAHRLVACTFSTLAGDQAEVARHVGVMTSYSGHVADRCAQMAGGQDLWTPSAPACGGSAGGAPSDPLALGQRIFDTGVDTSGQPVARTGGAGMMMASGCASCHGYDGLGRVTMMFTTPNITYANLTDPAGMVDPDGGRGPVYTDDLIRRAVTQGIDAAGDPLSTVMPRWQLSDADWGDLLRFLESLPPAPTPGGGAPAAGAGTISGTAFMGGMRSGTITAYGVSGGMMATPLGTSSLDGTGSFTIPIGAYGGTVMLQVAGGTFVDEATGTTMPMQAGDVLTGCLPSVAAGATTAGVQVTPLTSMAQARAQGMAGGMTAANTAAANLAVGDYFAAGDILTTAPIDPSIPGSGAGATPGARNHGMTIAAMSQYARTVGLTASSSGIVTAMMRDASDGVMNGMMGGTSISMGGMSGTGGMGPGMMGGTTLSPGAGTTGLATAMSAFVGSSRNRSGVSMADVQALVDGLAASDGTIR